MSAEVKRHPAPLMAGAAIAAVCLMEVVKALASVPSSTLHMSTARAATAVSSPTAVGASTRSGGVYPTHIDSALSTAAPRDRGDASAAVVAVVPQPQIANPETQGPSWQALLMGLVVLPLAVAGWLSRTMNQQKPEGKGLLVNIDDLLCVSHPALVEGAVLGACGTRADPIPAALNAVEKARMYTITLQQPSGGSTVQTLPLGAELTVAEGTQVLQVAQKGARFCAGALALSTTVAQALTAAQRPIKPSIPKTVRLCAVTGVAGGGGSRKKVVGIGVTGVDYLARVDHFPAPDEKMRAESMEEQGGGNAGNACTAMARLGLEVELVAGVGADGLGTAALAELSKDGVGTSHVVVNPDGTTPFSYIIVDRRSKTRTIIHTPPQGGDILSSAVDAAVLDGAALLYCDGRNTRAAIELAKKARSQGIPVLVEAERPRDGLDMLLCLADVVVTSEGFPKAYTGRGEGIVGPALSQVFARLPLCHTVITTLGAGGSVRVDIDPQMAASPLEVLVDEVVTEGQAQNQFIRREEPGVTVHYCPAVKLPPMEVMDTTGAGDAYIGATCYGVVQGHGVEQVMRLASEVAARKCKRVGARPGLPWAEELPQEML